MGYADYIVLGVIAVSILVGAVRGFVSEAFSLAVWVCAFLLAFQYSGALAMQLESHVELPSARTAIAFAGIFIVVLLVGGLLTYLVGLLITKTGLSGTDRLLGAVFGGIRGLCVVLALLLLAGFTPVPQDAWWRQSRGIQSLMPLADWCAQFLPDYLQEYLDLHPEPSGPERPAEKAGEAPQRAVAIPARKAAGA